MYVVRFLDVMIRPCMWCFILFIFVKSHFLVNQCNQYIPESATWWLDRCNLIISVVLSRGLNSVPKSHAWQLSAIKGDSNISHVGFSLMFPNIQHALLQEQRARLMMDVIGLTCGCGSKKISMFYWGHQWISGGIQEKFSWWWFSWRWLVGGGSEVWCRAGRRWRPKPTLHLMHSTNQPARAARTVRRAASQPQNFNGSDRTRRGCGAVCPELCIVWGHFYWSADKWFTWRDVTKPAHDGQGRVN